MDEAITRWINAAAGQNAVLDDVVIGIAIAGVPLMVLAVVGQWWDRHHRTHLRQIDGRMVPERDQSDAQPLGRSAHVTPIPLRLAGVTRRPRVSYGRRPGSYECRTPPTPT
jgi:hypothetical protein